MFDPTWPLFPTFAFLGFLLPLIPLPWHLHAWNSGTCYYIFWSSIGSLNLFVNAIVWRDTAVNLAPVWCDISTRISIGASVGIPAASLCINRRLYRIATVRSVTITRSEKRRAVLLDTLICIGIPVLCIALSYIVQGHRFNVWEQLGCYAAIYNTLPTFFLVDGWPIALGLISATYCVLSLKAFIKQQVAFNEFLSSHQGITISRYFRLMALSMTDIMCTIPLATYIIVLDVLEGVQPWISWANTHADFGRVDLFPAILWRSDRLTVLSVEFVRWSLAACGILFFLFFGFAEESRRHYRMAYHFIATRLGMRPADSGSSGRGLPMGSKGLPVYMPPPPTRRKRPTSFTSSLTDTIAAPEYSRSEASHSAVLTIDIKKCAPVPPPKSFTPTAEEIVMISQMLRISESTVGLAQPPAASPWRHSVSYSDYTFEAVTINTPTTSTHTVLTPTTPTTMVATPTTSSYTVHVSPHHNDFYGHSNTPASTH